MFFILVAFFAAALGVGFWFDNAITHSVLQFWWCFLVAGYVVLCVQLPASSHRLIHRFSIAGTVGVLSLLSVWIFDDVFTIYLVGTFYLVAWGLGRYASIPRENTGKIGTGLAVIFLIAITLIILPVSVNRILVKLPNLSARTTFTLHESSDARPDLDASFFNRINDKLEIEIYLGSQIYFGQPHDAPRLEIETGIRKVVVRLLSISYQHRLAYLDLPLFEMAADELLKISVTKESAAVDISQDRGYLLLTGFEVGESAWLQLPHMENHQISLIDQGLIVLFRLLLWLMVCFAIAVFLPRVGVEEDKLYAA